jgi:hypothetical protein
MPGHVPRGFFSGVPGPHDKISTHVEFYAR